ncbi:hypothetical protein GRO01_20930 [Gluconobacter roseus NBRC 3990]|uniref:Uncharacterized protein n=1 Tax=Gluconobacter roseus NBRC 3990 TaxID=1307950 RepID=A0A4Y3M7S7_9PROT|nr:hypothetical protein GRO01_20930 [Gluconobacter roseus NBRC 3990]GLP92346.1 hypothetical protein GCM10007871_03240 [Gluconobacter roseus NBRC 3990]
MACKNTHTARNASPFPEIVIPECVSYGLSRIVERSPDCDRLRRTCRSSATVFWHPVPNNAECEAS